MPGTSLLSVIVARPARTLLVTEIALGWSGLLDLACEAARCARRIGVALRVAMPATLVKIGTRALVPDPVSLEKAIPAISRARTAVEGGGAGPLGKGATVAAALVAVLVSTLSAAVTPQSSMLPACSADGTYVPAVAPSMAPAPTIDHW